MINQVEEAIEVLVRTPDILITMLSGLTDPWVMTNEGENTWSAYDVLGHLIHGELTDWIPRMEVILFYEEKTFVPFDRFAQFENSRGKTMADLLDEFKTLREENLVKLVALELDETKLNAIGIHPELGEANLSQLLSAWVVHDLGHITQISRVMAKRYTDKVGPWKAYLNILK